MWEGWKDIECYAYIYDEIPRVAQTAYDFTNWIKFSDYGIMRARPQITGSSRNGSSYTIPGNHGTLYSSEMTNGNAKVSVEMLIANVWTHSSSDYTAIERADQLVSILRQAKYFAYTEPGRDQDSYFIVRDVKFTYTDYDKDCQILKIEFEVHPIRYWLSGLIGVPFGQGNEGGITVYNNYYALTGDYAGKFVCGIETYNHTFDVLHFSRNSEVIKPIITNLQGTGQKDEHDKDTTRISCYLDKQLDPGHWEHEVAVYLKYGKTLPTGTTLDTMKCLIYANVNAEYVNENSKMKGDYTGLYVPVGRKARFHSNFTGDQYLFTNEGMLI